MHEAIFVAGVIPQKYAGFLLLSTSYCFGLQVGTPFAIEPVSNSYTGCLVESHEAGELGENAGHQRVN